MSLEPSFIEIKDFCVRNGYTEIDDIIIVMMGICRNLREMDESKRSSRIKIVDINEDLQDEDSYIRTAHNSLES